MKYFEFIWIQQDMIPGKFIQNKTSNTNSTNVCFVHVSEKGVMVLTSQGENKTNSS